MQRRYNLARMILASVVVLSLTPLMVAIDAQAQIAFVSDRDRNDEIYVMDDDGKNQRNLTNHPSDDYAPSWSPDGTRIVFMSDRDGHVPKGDVLPTFEIYVMDADGGNQQNLTNDPSHDMYPAWSPDGKRIAFTSYRDGHVHAIHGRPTAEIYVMDADGGNPQHLTNDLNDDRYPSWSPDGKRIVFSSERDGHFIGEFEITSSEIYLMDADGGNQQKLTENRKNDFSPSWSPDGKRIAFSSDRKGDFVNSEIYVMDADGGNQQKLTENRDWDYAPSWSPDGKRIAFSSDGDNKQADIYVMDADGGNPQNLTNHLRNDVSPAWFVPAFAVAPAGKKFTMWGRLKQVNR